MKLRGPHRWRVMYQILRGCDHSVIRAVIKALVDRPALIDPKKWWSKERAT